MTNFVGKDWSKFEKEFTIRTDAVWEKFKLRDYFRLFYKCFYFNPSTNDYQLLEPEDIYTMVYESCKKITIFLIPRGIGGLHDYLPRAHPNRKNPVFPNRNESKGQG